MTKTVYELHTTSNHGKQDSQNENMATVISAEQVTAKDEKLTSNIDDCFDTTENELNLSSDLSINNNSSKQGPMLELEPESIEAKQSPKEKPKNGLSQCPLCKKSLKHLRNHMREVHEEWRYKCEICQRPFPRWYEVLKHKRRIHEEGNNSVTRKVRRKVKKSSPQNEEGDKVVKK